VWSRHHQEQLELKKKERLREKDLLKFEPTINKKSTRLASQNARAKSSGGLTSREKNEINKMGDNYEDFLLSKVLLFKDKLAEKARALETERSRTYAPNLLIPSIRSSNASRNLSSGNKRSKSAQNLTIPN